MCFKIQELQGVLSAKENFLGQNRKKTKRCYRWLLRSFRIFCKMVITVDSLASVSEKCTGSKTHCTHNGPGGSLCNNIPQAFRVLRTIMWATHQWRCPSPEGHPPARLPCGSRRQQPPKVGERRAILGSSPVFQGSWSRFFSFLSSWLLVLQPLLWVSKEEMSRDS